MGPQGPQEPPSTIQPPSQPRTGKVHGAVPFMRERTRPECHFSGGELGPQTLQMGVITRLHNSLLTGGAGAWHPESPAALRSNPVAPVWQVPGPTAPSTPPFIRDRCQRWDPLILSHAKPQQLEANNAHLPAETPSSSGRSNE